MVFFGGGVVFFLLLYNLASQELIWNTYTIKQMSQKIT